MAVYAVFGVKIENCDFCTKRFMLHDLLWVNWNEGNVEKNSISKFSCYKTEKQTFLQTILYMWPLSCMQCLDL